jgi:hypothetical protein
MPAPREELKDRLRLIVEGQGVDADRLLAEVDLAIQEGLVDTPMVAMSASAFMVNAGKSTDLFEATLGKPFDVATLLAIVERYWARNLARALSRACYELDQKTAPGRQIDAKSSISSASHFPRLQAIFQEVHNTL